MRSNLINSTLINVLGINRQGRIAVVCDDAARDRAHALPMFGRFYHQAMAGAKAQLALIAKPAAAGAACLADAMGSPSQSSQAVGMPTWRTSVTRVTRRRAVLAG